MIVTRLIGGLGNQLFQYAFGLSLARQTGQELFLDDSAFENYRLHPLAIDRFAITAKRLPEEHRHRIPGRYRGTSRVREKLEQVAGKLLGPHSAAPLTLRREKPFGYQPEYLTADQDLYLDGSWQGEVFFPEMREELCREFALADSLSPKSRAIEEEIATCKSVAVHVRRGDYVTNPEAAKIYRCLEAGYYRACLKDLQKKSSGIRIFLFSNDIDWCLSNLDVGIPFTPVTHNSASTAHEDMTLISRCRHAVIANSTFSWWGAFLGANRPGRRVYYPDPWFVPGSFNGNALGCQDWIGEKSISSQAPSCTAA